MLPETAIPVLSGVCAPAQREERVGCGKGEKPAKTGLKTIRCDGKVGSLPRQRTIAFLGCQRHLAGQSTFGSSSIGKRIVCQDSWQLLFGRLHSLKMRWLRPPPGRLPAGHPDLSILQPA